MSQIARSVAALMTGALAVAGAAPAGAGPQTLREQSRPAPFASQPPHSRSTRVCGMTVLTPDGGTDFKLREETSPPNAPTFTLEVLPAPPCERVVRQNVPGFSKLWGQQRPTTTQTPQTRRFLFRP